MSTTRIKMLGGFAAICSGLGIIPATFFAMMSIFMFDAPGSETSPLTLGFALGLLAAPMLLFVSARKGVKVVRNGNSSDLRLALGLPAALASWLLLMWLLLHAACGGSLVCH